MISAINDGYKEIPNGHFIPNIDHRMGDPITLGIRD